MSDVWLTHPDLTASHDHKVARAAIGQWAASGWQIRASQADHDIPAEPAPEPELEPEPETEATSEAADTTPETTKKGAR